MPTGRRRRTGSTGLLALLLLLGPLAACTTDAPGSPGPRGPHRAAPAGPASPTTRDVVRDVRRVLARRAAAVRRHDAAALRAGLAPRPGLVRQQRSYLANLDQLPLSRFRYVVDPGDVVRDGGAWRVGVRLLTQLAGYDARPVATPARLTFVPARHGRPRLLLASVRDPAWERAHRVVRPPWDDGPVVVRRDDGVLGVFDARSVARAGSVLGSVRSGLADVAARVPYRWPRRVVVYALSDPAYLDSLPNLPGDDPTRLDAVALPVPAARGDRLAASRVLLSPGTLARAGEERDRLVRHELTHVAVGEHDDRAPVWLAEGVAEWVSVQPIASGERRIPSRAVLAARRGIHRLPGDRSFNDARSATHYALAWWVCEYVADLGGPDAVWSLLDALDRPGVRGRAARDRVLRLRTGLDGAELAQRAAGLIVSTYAGTGDGSG